MSSLQSPVFTYSLQTLGCKANLTDSQYLELRLQREGGVPESDANRADVLIVNSCTVTDRADRDALGLLKRFRGRSRVAVLTGCMAEVSPESVNDPALANFERVILARNSGKALLPEAIARVQNELASTDITARDPGQRTLVLQGSRIDWHQEMDLEPGAALVGGNSQRTRVFFKVQDGCNQFCAFCIIPHARGRSRSLSSNKIIEEIRSFQSEGVKEVVLTAIHAADYENGGLNFVGLIRKILAETELPRLRLTSLDPAEISSELIDLMASEPRLCSHFHVSLQSGSSKVLSLMKRHYDAERAANCLQEIREKLPTAFVGMDLIAGFPGETDLEHEETMTLLKNNPWSRLHVFPYSVRKSTQAARMVANGLGIAEAIKRSRAAELRKLSDDRLQSTRESRIGTVVEVLTEAKPVIWNAQSFTQGHARSYLRVLLAEKISANKLVRAQIESLGPNDTVLARLL